LNLDLTFYSLHGKLKTPARIKTLDRFATAVNDTKSVLLTTDVASRGIDIENVDLVIQLDPPTDPDVFLHRCGRTGRANNAGQAIVFLDEGREEDYVDFLEVRKIEMEELEIEKLCVDDEKLFQGTRDWVLKDRARHDKAVLAYVSFIRYYSKHTASSIFRLQTLDYLGLAKMYGVLRLPKMPEIKQFLKDSPDGGVFNIDIDFKEYKYLNPKKEEARLEELANEAKKYEELTKKKEKAKENSSWSNRNGGVKGEKTERFLQRELKKRKADLALKDSDDEEDQETDWKDLVKKSKREKKSSNEGIAQFDDL
jgi:ATP-dependent RNA helicase DDX55/SPB4